VTVVGGPADQRVGADDVARHLQRQVILAQVQHGGAGGVGDVGAVVDGQQGAVSARGIGKYLQRCQFVARLQGAQPLLTRRALVTQLNDVHPAGQGGIGEFGQIAAIAARIGAQIQPGARKSRQRCMHTATLATSVGSRHGSPGNGV
jgi:hypothetical protein